jgi:hypothetical protein
MWETHKTTGKIIVAATFHLILLTYVTLLTEQSVYALRSLDWHQQMLVTCMCKFGKFVLTVPCAILPIICTYGDGNHHICSEANSHLYSVPAASNIQVGDKEYWCKFVGFHGDVNEDSVFWDVTLRRWVSGLPVFQRNKLPSFSRVSMFLQNVWNH